MWIIGGTDAAAKDFKCTRGAWYLALTDRQLPCLRSQDLVCPKAVTVFVHVGPPCKYRLFDVYLLLWDHPKCGSQGKVIRVVALVFVLC